MLLLHQFQNFRDKHSSQPGGGSSEKGDKGSATGANEHNSVDNSSETMSTNSANSPVRCQSCTLAEGRNVIQEEGQAWKELGADLSNSMDL